MNDLRYALRRLRQTPGFTLTAVLTLALGIGASTAIFSVIHPALLRPLPYRDPGHLVQLWSVTATGHFPWVSGAQFKQWRDHAKSFAGVSLVADRLGMNLIEAGRAECVTGAEVSANYLDVLGIAPRLGRGFNAGEDQLGGQNHVVVLSYEWWIRRFGGDPGIVGRTLNFNLSSYTVIGVLSPRAIAPDRVNYLVPLVLEDGAWRTDPTIPWVSVAARLKPGVTPHAAEAEANALTAELYRRVLPNEKFWGVQVLPLQQVLVENSRPTFLMLLGAVALVLLIVCANLANLLLVRATTRRKEVAVRLALGAGVSRVVRQMLIESLLLALAGGALGCAGAWLGLDLLRHLTASSLPQLIQPEVDLRVLLFSLSLAMATGVVFGLAPALQTRGIDVNETLKEAARGVTSGGRTRVQSALIVSEIALTIVLLVGAGLLLRSFARVVTADAGFEPRQALVCDLALIYQKFPVDEPLLQFERELVRRIAALPGVEAVGTASTVPLSESYWGAKVGRSETPSAEHTLATGLDYVGADYFRAMGIRLVRGRLFAEADNTLIAPPVALVNQELAAALFGPADPLGRRISFNGVDWEIVGLVGSVRQTQIDAPAFSHVYAPQVYKPRTICLVIRAQVPPLSLVDDIRRVGASLDPDQSLANFRTLDQAVSASLQERRVTLALVALFALVALALACLGVYGVTAYAIQQREHELCIRLALGAQHRDIIAHLLRDGAALGVTGLLLGCGGAAIGARLIASRLYGVSSLDALIFIGVPLLVALVTLLAIWAPARRTRSLNYLAALHTE